MRNYGRLRGAFVREQHARHAWTLDSEPCSRRAHERYSRIVAVDRPAPIGSGILDERVLGVQLHCEYQRVTLDRRLELQVIDFAEADVTGFVFGRALFYVLCCITGDIMMNGDDEMRCLSHFTSIKLQIVFVVL